MVKYTQRGLVVKRPGVLSKVQMLNLVLGVGVFSLLPMELLPYVLWVLGALLVAGCFAPSHHDERDEEANRSRDLGRG